MMAGIIWFSLAKSLLELFMVIFGFVSGSGFWFVHSGYLGFGVSWNAFTCRYTGLVDMPWNFIRMGAYGLGPCL